MSKVIKGKRADKLVDSILAIMQESKTVEFKRMGGKKVVGKILETIVAMANNEGGHIFLGVDDPEFGKLKGGDRLVGVEENLNNLNMLIQELSTISPYLIGEQSITQVKDSKSGKTIAIIKVPKATEDFHVIGKRVFVRQDTGNQELSPREYLEMVYAKGFKKADGELVQGIDFDLLDTKWFAAWRKQRGVEGSPEEVLPGVGLAAKDDQGVLRPKRAAVLLFAEFPDSLMADGRCAVRIFRYKDSEARYGARPNLIGKPINMEGPTIKLIRDAQNQVLTLLATGVRVESGFIDEHEVPERVIKEAITNAVIHRDYHIKADIEIRIYDNRVEVVSPGMLVYNITLQNIGLERALDYRNDLLVKYLREFPDPPNLDANEGINAMRREMKAQKLYPPTYSTWPTKDELGFKYYVKVKLLKENTPSEWEKVESYLKENNYISNAQAREVADVEQMTSMSKMLKRWVQQGLIEKVVNSSKSTRDTRYKLKMKPEFEDGM